MEKNIKCYNSKITIIANRFISYRFYSTKQKMANGTVDGAIAFQNISIQIAAGNIQADTDDDAGETLWIGCT